MLCAEHIEERELRDSYKIPGVSSKDLSSDQKNKQCPKIYHNRILICIDTSLDSPTPLWGRNFISCLFDITHRDKFILELKIITDFTLWKWKGMYPEQRKEVKGLSISQRRLIYKPCQGCHCSHAMPSSPSNVLVLSLKTPAPYGSLKEGWRLLKSSPTLKKSLHIPAVTHSKAIQV